MVPTQLYCRHNEKQHLHHYVRTKLFNLLVDLVAFNAGFTAGFSTDCHKILLTTSLLRQMK